MKLTYSLILLLATALVSTALVRHKLLSGNSSEAEKGPVRMIRFVLSDDGLYPRRMQVEQGLLNISVEDKTRSSQGLVIESVKEDQRTRVTQIDRAQNQLRARALVRLEPGRYLVSDASKLTHTAELIVNP